VYADGVKRSGSGTATTGNIELNSVGTEKDITITVPDGTEYISFGGWAWGGEVQISNLQLSLGSIATAYEPYQGETYEVEFPTEAGTVYGGSLTIAEDGSGVLTVDGLVDTIVAQNGNLTSTYFNWPTNGAGAVLGNNVRASFNRNSQTSNMITVSDKYRWRLCNQVPHLFAYATDTPHWYINNQLYLYLPSNLVDETKESWVSYIANNPIHVYIQFATPITYTLTAPEITTLLGQNNLWHDANGDISVGYKADTKLYIDNKIAELVARIVNS
jgi:hypothetical protein